jgi:hypothetical protein
MDPNATLASIRELISDIDRRARDGEHIGADRAYALIEPIEALDTWLSRGGFLPTDWERR